MDTSTIKSKAEVVREQRAQAKALAEEVGTILLKREENHDFYIKPKHDHTQPIGIYAIAKPVARFGDKEIKDTARRMIAWLNANNGAFPAPYVTSYAISHCQVADEPYRLFVVSSELVRNAGIELKRETRQQNRKNFFFPTQAIFNAEILETPEKMKAKIPKREVTKENGKVSSKITVNEGEVSNRISVPDACMSFPQRTKKNTERFFRIKVRYQTMSAFGVLVSKTEWVEGLKAHIFQHEIDHANAINIYYGKSTAN